MSIYKIPEKYFEIAGTIVGLLTSIVIAVQVKKEWVSEKESTLSPVFVFGFFLIYAFWTLYGFRFKRFAVWSTTGIAMLIQGVLLVVVLLK